MCFQWEEIVVTIPQMHLGQSILELSYSCVLIRMHTRVHGGLDIYLHKMPGKHAGYGQMLGGEGFG